MGEATATKLGDGHPARRTARLKLFEPAEMRQGTQTQRVHLLDLSLAGALLHAPEPPAVGAVVTLTCERFSRLAKIAWAADRRIGVAFLRSLDGAELAGTVGVKSR